MTYDPYDIPKELARIEDELISAGGELTDDLEKRLDDCGLAFNEKMEAVIKRTRIDEGRVEAIDAEIARLTALKKPLVNRMKRYKGYVLESMNMTRKKKIELPTLTLTIINNPPRVEIEDKNKIPSAYTTTHIELIVNKDRIKEALKRGEKVEGARLVHGKRLGIR